MGLWAMLLLVWGLGLGWRHFGRDWVFLANPGRIDFALSLESIDADRCDLVVHASGPAERIAERLGSPATHARTPDVQTSGVPAGLSTSALAPTADKPNQLPSGGLTVHHNQRLRTGEQVDSPGAARILSGELLFPGTTDRAARIPASAVLNLPADASVLWLGSDVLERPTGETQPWTIDGPQLADLARGTLVLGSSVLRVPCKAGECLWIVGDQTTAGDAQAQAAGLAQLRSWYAELEDIIAAGPEPLDVVVVHNPPSDPPLQTVRQPTYVAFGLAGQGPGSRARFLEELALGRLGRRAALPVSWAWLDAALARRIALALAPEGSEAGEWRRLLAYGVFLSTTCALPLSQMPNRGSSDRYAYTYLARHKGPLVLRALEQRGAPERSSRQQVVAWLAVRDALAAGASLPSALQPAFGKSAAQFLKQQADSTAPLGVTGFGAAPALEQRPYQRGVGTHRLTLALSTHTENFLETCGCKLQQAGGVARRAQVIAGVQQQGPVLALDLGNLFPRIERRAFDAITAAELSTHALIDRELGYALHALGPNELYAGAALLSAVAVEGAPIFSANNAHWRGAGPAPWSSAACVIERAGLRLRLIPIAPETPYWIAPEEFARRTEDIEIEDPIEAVRRAARAASKDEILVVAGALPTWRLRELCNAVPEVDLVLSSDQRALSDWSDRRARAIDSLLDSGFAGDTAIVLANAESHGVTLVDLEFGGDGQVLAFQQRDVLLGTQLPEHPPSRALLDQMYAGLEVEQPDVVERARRSPLAALDQEAALLDRLRATGSGKAGSGDFGSGHPGTGGQGYVGSAACQACHAEIHARWRQTPHGQAMRTLEDAHRANAPACVRCHVVGYGLPGGYSLARAAQSAGLRDVGCETCHGPGRLHALEYPGDSASIRRRIEQSACELCHDADHSESLEGRLHWPAQVCSPAGASGAGGPGQ